MENTDLKQCLQKFKVKVNENDRIKKLIRGWNPAIIIEANDKQLFFTLLIENEKIFSIVDSKEEKNHQIHIQGSNNVLQSIFSGDLNPAEAVLDGKIAVFGDDKDQIKLDAISLILWGN